MENLPNDIDDALKAKIKSLLEQIQRLEAENAELHCTGYILPRPRTIPTYLSMKNADKKLSTVTSQS
jgi:hypothetical protein